MNVQVVEKVPALGVVNPLSMLDVRDSAGHLLFKYDSLTDTIEIKSRGKIFCVNTTELRFIGKRNVLADAPQTSIEAIGRVEVGAELPKGFDETDTDQSLEQDAPE